MSWSFPLPNLSRIAIRPRFLIALMLSVLIAFAVVIAMAGLLPPGATRPVRIDAVAAALRGTGDATLLRTVAVGAPAAGDRWLEAPGARRQLAAILRVPAADVRLLVAAPLQTRPATVRTALAGHPPVRAGFLPFAQDAGTTSVSAPPVVVAAPPPPVVVATPAPRPATSVARPTPAPVVRPRTEPERPVARAAEPSRPRAEARRTPERTAPVDVTPAPAVVADVPAVLAPVVPTPAPAAMSAAKADDPGPVQEIAGEFRAALRLPAGGWAIVRPLPEPFPSTTQQRMILWFLVALALTLSIAWGLALMLARPLMRFADAAERSGREPGYVLPSVGIPAELAPALVALTRLQTRAQSLEGDRSAFAGTLRNELRAPLERLRAGLDDAPRPIREAFHDDLTDIEEAVAALQLFLSDAGAPTLRRHDLGELVRAAAATASESGEPVVADATTVAWVEADPEAIGRLFEHLIVYGRRQGGSVLLRLAVDGDGATVEVTDSGRPEPAAFAVGLHGKAERAGTVRPSGPGLAVARSIARTHGGEVLLVRSDQGMAVKLRLPLAGR